MGHKARQRRTRDTGLSLLLWRLIIKSATIETHLYLAIRHLLEHTFITRDFIGQAFFNLTQMMNSPVLCA